MVKCVMVAAHLQNLLAKSMLSFLKFRQEKKGGKKKKANPPPLNLWVHFKSR